MRDLFVENEVDKEENKKKNTIMPGKDLKGNYPPCNRAFALRMMNPMSYQQGHMSPLDGEIQPVVKKTIAKAIRERTGSENSFDDISLSPASSLSSFQDMELYDIDENGKNHGMNGDVRLNSSFDSYRTKPSPRSSVSGKSNGNGFISRSYSSSDGFNGSNFQRGSSVRISTPARIRSKSSPRKVSNGASYEPSVNRVNGYRPDVTNYLQNKTVQNNTPEGGSSLRRSQSLRERSKKTLMNKSNDKQNQPKDNVTKLRVATTRSSQLRAKIHQNGTTPTPKQGRTDSGLKKKTAKGSLEDWSESDSSAIYSEINAYNPRNNPRSRHTARHASKRERRDSNNTLSETSSIEEFDSALQLSTPSTPSARPSLSSSPILQNSDKFSAKLNEVCQLITTQHPHDFQILETLVEMQTAYEDRNQLVTRTISDLRRRVNELESKSANSSNIPALVIPLMRASTNFQSKLQSIMDSQHAPKCTTDQYVQATEDSIRESTLDEISTEAYAVAAELEKLSLSQNGKESQTKKNCSSNDTLDGYAIIPGSSTEV